ncbi:MAG: TonB-dependent receptor [Longimicrobiales bacterium]
MSCPRRTTARFLTAATSLILFVAPTSAQQSATTGTIRGRVAGSDNQPVVGAQVVTRNTTTGLERSVLSDTEGRYVVPLLPPGGPYTVQVTSIGFQSAQRNGIMASSGVATTVDFSMAVQAVAIDGIEVVAGTRVDVTQAGVVQRVATQQVENLPVAGRDFTDFLNLSPLVSPQPGIGTGGQFSIGGARTSGTNVQIDGADANNIYFGENRGSSRSPFAFSLESIKEFQLISNGYDVEYGSYQGGVVNAVTRTGSNDFSGTAFYYRRGERLTGDDFLGAPPRDYYVNQFGASASGPVLRDRLHFFVSADVQRKAQPIFATVPGAGTTAIAQDSLTRVINALVSRYGITGASNYFGTFEQEENNTVLFGRLDWTVSDKHRLTLRQNFSDFEQTNDRLSATEAITSTGAFLDKVYSTVAELNSVFSGNLFNTLRFQWSYEDRPRPAREDGGYIPQFTIGRVTGTTSVFFGGDGTIFRNRLEESKLQFIDNLNYRLGNHSLKLGGNVILGNNVNTFWLSGAGTFSFTNLADFEAGRINSYSRNTRACPVALTANAAGEPVICPQYDVPLAEFDYTEYSAYVQDDFQATDRLLVTLGLRYQGTKFPDSPPTAPLVRDTLGYDTSLMPEFTGISPRFSFAYDFGGQARVLRGGVGVMVGRAPTVLAGNVISSERPLLSVFCTGTNVPSLTPAVVQEMMAASQGTRNPTACRGGAAPTGRAEYALFSEDFELPQTLKASLGYEHLLVSSNTRIGIDLIYSGSTNQFTVKDLNFGARACQAVRAPGQPRDPLAIASCFALAGEQNRPVFTGRTGWNPASSAPSPGKLYSASMERVYLNTSDGEARSYSATVTLDQQVSDKLHAALSYAYVNAHDNSSFSCCTSNEGWGSELTAGNPNAVGDVGDEDLLWGVSRFERRHTVAANFRWRAPYGFNINGIWRSQSGLPFTPVVNGDVNGDGQLFNDRAMISRSLQWEGGQTDLDKLNGLLERWDCLAEQLDQVARRNSCRGPWWHSLDLRLSKDITTFRGQRAELLIDLFNVLNGMNNDWSRYMGVFTGATNLVDARSFDQATGRVVYRVNYFPAVPASGTTPATPERGFGVAQPTGFDPYQFQAQIGLRYRF